MNQRWCLNTLDTGPFKGSIEVVQLSWTVWGGKLNKLLVGVLRGLVATAGAQAFVRVVVNTVGDACPCVGQAGKNRPLASFAHLRFQARPAAFGLRIVTALAAAALETPRLVVVAQGAGGVAATRPAAVGADEPARRGGLRPKRAL